MSESITYYAITRDEIDRLVSRAARPELVSTERANQLFQISEGLLLKLEQEGRIQSVTIHGHKKMRRWKYEDLRNLFQPSKI